MRPYLSALHCRMRDEWAGEPGNRRRFLVVHFVHYQERYETKQSKSDYRATIRIRHFKS